MAPSKPASMDIAVALFEKGFTEDRIQEALCRCDSVDEAVRWLSPGGSSSGAAAARPAAATAADAKAGDAAASLGAVPTATRRRQVRKVASTDFSESSPLSKGQPVIISSAGVAPAATCSPTPTASTAAGAEEEAASGVSVASPAVASSASGGCGREAKSEPIPIEPRDAREFWIKARARWPSLAKGMLQATWPEEEEAAGSPHAAGQWRTGAEAPATATEDDAPAGETDAEAESPRPRKEARKEADLRDDSQGGGSQKRPPATPCSADTQQAASSSSAAAQDEGAEAIGSPYAKVAKLRVSPSSSPHSMRLNERPELCQICCNDVPVQHAVRLGCDHGWYCSLCMVRHTEARLSVGAASVTCPQCLAPLAERDLRRMVPDELLERLLARSLEQAVSSVADLWACPTPNCPMRVALEEGEEPKLKCTQCGKSSCLRCGAQPWHKGLTCQEHAEKMGARNKKARKDEALLQQWIEETGTKQCPTCRMGVTKQNIRNQQTQYSECHKMLCRNCNTKFCFKCLAVLTDSYTCGCTIDAHGFIDPRTGKRMNHLKAARARAKPVGKAAAKCKAKG